MEKNPDTALNRISQENYFYRKNVQNTSGLLPTLGIFHRNQYNAYCLADDIMEPYRPYVDMVVCDIIRMNGRFLDMTAKMKEQLLSIPALDVQIGRLKSPLMIAVQRTTASLAKCFEENTRKLLYPAL